MKVGYVNSGGGFVEKGYIVFWGEIVVVFVVVYYIDDFIFFVNCVYVVL